MIIRKETYMSSHKKSLVIAGFLLLSGCGAYEVDSLTTKHPAHPEAKAAPVASVSKTLSYTASSVPSSRPTSTAASAQQEQHESHHAAAPSAQETVVGEGKIVATVPNSNQLVLEHGEIKDFMGPMTMGYQIDPPSLADGLQPGDQIRFTIDVPKKTIVRIEKLNK
jgi:Cu/Ag efflux protein CusF